jgi:hypothetical protein
MHQLASENNRKILPLVNADDADRKEKTSNQKGHPFDSLFASSGSLRAGYGTKDKSQRPQARAPALHDSFV